MSKKTDYSRAKALGLTSKDRWVDDIPHHPKTVRLMGFLGKHDHEDWGDRFQWKTGGDGDSGEVLMYQMDAFFELLDTEEERCVTVCL